MANYTYEQRQMIAEYLENDILMAAKSCLDDKAFLISLENEIRRLKQTTFGDIKNQVGIRFKVRESGDCYVIVHDINNEEYCFVSLDNYCLFSLNDIDNNVLVEVINETTSN